MPSKKKIIYSILGLLALSGLGVALVYLPKTQVLKQRAAPATGSIELMFSPAIKGVTNTSTEVTVTVKANKVVDSFIFSVKPNTDMLQIVPGSATAIGTYFATLVNNLSADGTLRIGGYLKSSTYPPAGSLPLSLVSFRVKLSAGAAPSEILKFVDTVNSEFSLEGEDYSTNAISFTSSSFCLGKTDAECQAIAFPSTALTCPTFTATPVTRTDGKCNFNIQWPDDTATEANYTVFRKPDDDTTPYSRVTYREVSPQPANWSWTDTNSGSGFPVSTVPIKYIVKPYLVRDQYPSSCEEKEVSVTCTSAGVPTPTATPALSCPTLNVQARLSNAGDSCYYNLTWGATGTEVGYKVYRSDLFVTYRSVPNWIDYNGTSARAYFPLGSTDTYDVWPYYIQSEPLNCQQNVRVTCSGASCSYKAFGDADCDGKVNRDDLAQWITQSVSGTPFAAASADFSGNGTVGREDLASWITGFANPAVPH